MMPARMRSMRSVSAANASRSSASLRSRRPVSWSRSRRPVLGGMLPSPRRAEAADTNSSVRWSSCPGLIAREAGGWASAATVEEVYGHADLRDPAFDAALRALWGKTT
jgi:hypothetical protein